MSKLKKEEYNAVKIIWNYHLMHHKIVKSDAILVLGTHDISLAKRGSKLLLDGFADYIIFSGGIVHPPEVFGTKEPITEADAFAEVAKNMGVDENKIIIENQASNTGENFSCTKTILEKIGIKLNSFILVQKPYMERRTYATARVQWPNKEFIVTSPDISLDDYLNSDIPTERFINTMVGDLQRIKLYPSLGFQIAQDIPDKIWSKYEYLVNLGYDKRLVK